jgi:HTH-type transcriptional regulator/antitoxin HigA
MTPIDVRRPVAQVFPPGDFIREEIEARGWTQGDFAKILGRPLQTVNAIINGKKEITPRTAVEIAAAFGTSPELWLNLETAYSLAITEPADPEIARRAKAHPSITDR